MTGTAIGMMIFTVVTVIGGFIVAVVKLQKNSK